MKFIVAPLSFGQKFLLSLAIAAFTFSAAGQTTLLNFGATWKYLDDGSDQGATWKDPGFIDDTWLSGPALLGFTTDAPLIATTNTSGNITYYYRHAFNVPSIAGITNLRAALRVDDGAVAYLNGAEIFRHNMPTGEVTFLTTAPSAASDDGQDTNYVNFPTGSLQAGNNLLAVEVHQTGETSSDVVFDLKLEANPLPIVAINSPTNTQTVLGDIVTIRGTAVPAGGTVALVEAFQGNIKVGQSTNPNFTIVWEPVTPGSYTLRAKVTDTSGLVSTSAPVNITVEALPASVLIPLGSRWKYLDNGSDQGTAWRGTNYDDSAWAEGPAELGYGDGGEATVVSFGPNSAAKYPTTYFRKKFVVGNPAAYQDLTLETVYDDGAIIYINGVEVHRVRIGPEAIINFDTYIGAGADYTPDITTISAGALVAGTNVIAVEMHQADAGSSDVSFDLRLEGTVDTTAPYLATIDPAVGSTRLDLTTINLMFNEPVAGVNAADLLINSEPATNLVVNRPAIDFTFQFPQPPTGVVQVTFAANHGITDLSPLALPFGGTNYTYTLDTNAPSRANLIISEFLASNNTGIRDEDGNRSDWIEIYNQGPLDANLEGWFLTDEIGNLTKWRFPAKTLAQNRYLIVFATGLDKTNPSAPYLHVNFNLSAGGEFLALVDPQTNIVSQFDPVALSPDISYGRDVANTTQTGYYSTPTPGAPNSTSGSGFAVAPDITPASGVYTQNSISVTITVPPGTTVRYTLDGTLPSAASTVYSTPLNMSANATLKARAFPSGGGLFPSPVTARSYIFLDGTTRTFSSKLPIIVMSTEGRAIPANVVAGGARAKGTVLVVDTYRGTASLTGKPDYIGNADFEVFGQTSAGFPKQPHNIELQDPMNNDLNLSLLGFPPDGDWKLRNPYSDKCLMNDFLAFELFEQMGNYSVRRKLVEVFRDTGGGKLTYPGDYHGVLLLSEKIEVDRNRVDIAQLTSIHTNEPGITGGYMFKKDKDSAGDINFSTTGGAGHGAIPLKIHEPKPKDLNNNANHPQLVWLRTHINRMEASLYAANWTNATGTNHYSHYLDIDSFVDAHWIVEFPKQIDGYRISNYFSKDRGGKIKNVPIWDWNLSFGNADYLEGGLTNGWYYEDVSQVDHMWGRRLMNGTSAGNGTQGDAFYNQKVADRWSVLRTNIMNGPRVTNRIEEVAQLLDAVSWNDTSAADRDFARFPRLGTYIWPNPSGPPSWHVNYVTPNTYAGIISEMKKWTMGRFNWVDAQFAQRPELGSAGGLVQPGFSLGMSAPAGHTIVYTLNGDDPRLPTGALRPGALTYTTPITVTTNIRVFARAQRAGTWMGTWSGPNEISLYTSLPNLRITEVMYHPHDPAPGIYNDEDFEYIEVKNTGGTTLNLNRFTLSGGIDFDFPNQNLAAGAYAVIVANSNAFRARYGNTITVLGSYNNAFGTNRLDNGGERLVLHGPMREPILDFRYSDEWYPITDGHGYSLVIRNENDSPTNWPYATSWRPSGQLGGSPGAADPAPPAFDQVVINEIRTHTDFPQVDEIELRNLGGSTANIAGWFLTDDFGNPYKYKISGPASIGAGGFFVINENQFGGPSGLQLSSLGGEVYLFAGDGTNVTGYVQGFDYGPLPNGATFGRHVISTGDDQFPIQSTPSVNGPNAGPLVGPVIISEIFYHPIDVVVEGVAYNNSEDEYIELQNTSGALVRLYDQAHPTNTWRLDDAVEFTFPPNTSISAGGFLLVVAFDPANTAEADAFRARTGVPPGVPLYGPFSGNLNNDGDRVELRRPDVPELNGSVPYILVERVSYDDEAPWSPAADGLGPALQRISPTSYGNDPASWVGGGRSPGAAYVPGQSPTITSQPTNTTVVAGSSATFSVEVTGPGPFTYNWRVNGQPVPGGGTATLVLNNVQTSQAGDYDVVVFNSAGSVVSSPATLTVLVPASIIQQPQDRFVPGSTNDATFGQSGSNVVFAVSATTQNPPLTYQWRRNGEDIPGANQSTLTINNASIPDDGLYDVVLTDTVSSIASQPARLQIVVRPFFVVPHIQAQTVSRGSTVTFSQGVKGHPLPMQYRWRKGSGFMATNFSDTFLGSVTIPNVQFTEAATYTVIPYNDLGSNAATLSKFAYLTVVDPPVDQTVAVGANATFQARLATSVATSLRYQWFFNGAPISGATTTNLTVTNVQPSSAGVYSINITNNGTVAQGFPPLVASFGAVLSIPEADSDGDGMPDWFEQRYNLSPGNDAGLDADGDGVSNIDEYRAGTDPRDPQSYLRITSITPDIGGVTLEFLAVSNKSYSVLYRDVVDASEWTRLQDFSVRNTNRVERLLDSNGQPQRYYRLTTPRAP